MGTDTRRHTLGFGEGIATVFAEEGAKVIILDINATGGER